MCPMLSDRGKICARVKKKIRSKGEMHHDITSSLEIEVSIEPVSGRPLLSVINFCTSVLLWQNSSFA